MVVNNTYCKLAKWHWNEGTMITVSLSQLYLTFTVYFSNSTYKLFYSIL